MTLFIEMHGYLLFFHRSFQTKNPESVGLDLYWACDLLSCNSKMQKVCTYVAEKERVRKETAEMRQ